MHARRVLRLRDAKLRDLARKCGIESDSALAAHIGVQQSTVSRLLNGDTQPGEKIIAALLGAFPGTKFEALFEVVDASAPLPARQPARKAS